MYLSKPHALKLLSLTIGLGLVAMSGSQAHAKKSKTRDNDKWATKGGSLGVGADGTMGGTTGLAARYYVDNKTGIIATLGVGFNTLTTTPDGGKDTTSQTMGLGLGLYGEYKLAAFNQGSLSGLAGVDIFSESQSVTASGTTTEASTSNFSIGLGLKGEVFLNPRFSLYSKAGLSVDPAGANDVQALGYDPADVAASGMSVSLDGSVWGNAGFTVWLD